MSDADDSDLGCIGEFSNQVKTTFQRLLACSLFGSLALLGVAGVAQAKENPPLPPAQVSSPGPEEGQVGTPSPATEKPEPVKSDVSVTPASPSKTPERPTTPQPAKNPQPVYPVPELLQAPDPEGVPVTVESNLPAAEPTSSASASSSATSSTPTPSSSSASPSSLQPSSSNPTKAVPATVNSSENGPGLMTVILVLAGVVVIAGAAIAIFALNRPRAAHH